MDRYTPFFLIAILLPDIVLLVLKNRFKSIWLIVGMIFVPLFSYIIFYNFDYNLIANKYIYLIGFLGAFVTLYLFLFLTSYKESSEPVKIKHPILKTILFFIVQIFSLTFILALPWTLDTFPLSNTDAILFTLFAPAEGADKFVIQTFINKVLYGNVLIYALFIVVPILLSVMLRKVRIGIQFQQKPFFMSFSPNGSFLTNLEQIEKNSAIFLFACVVASLPLAPGIMSTPAFDAIFMDGGDSELYKNHYILPKSIAIPPRTAADSTKNPKNLVVIFVESMENNFKAYTPELNEWKKKGRNFMPGGESVAGAGWTIAGVTAALCGIPLNMPLGITEYHGKHPSYLPGATCIMDLLQKADYNQFYVQGSSAEFTQKRDFWTTHGNVTVVDDSLVKEKLGVDKSYHVFWGIEDRMTFTVARQMLDSVAALQAPFAGYFLTVDTHQPNGYLDSACHYSEDTPFKNALRCSSKQLGDFLSWIEAQPWYKNTVVLFTGDHTMQMLSKKAGVPKEEPLYTTAFFLNAPEGDYKTRRTFSNLDLAPSILEALGWELPGHGFALGRSLFANEPTMLEIYGRDSLDVLLRQRSVQYDSLLYPR